MFSVKTIFTIITLSSVCHKYFCVTFCTFAATAGSSCLAWTLCRVKTVLNQFTVVTVMKHVSQINKHKHCALYHHTEVKAH